MSPLKTLLEAVTGKPHDWGQYRCPSCGHEFNVMCPKEFQSVGCPKCKRKVPTEWRRYNVF